MSAFRTTLRRVPSCAAQAANTYNFSTQAPKMMLFPRISEFNPLFRLIDEVERSFPTRENFNNSNARSFAPRVDIREEEQRYLIQAEVPGLEQDNISIEWADAETLTLSGRTERHSGVASPQKAVEQPATPEPKKVNQPTVEDTEDEDAVVVPRVEKDTDSEHTLAPAPEKQQEAEDPATSVPEPKYWVSERSVGSFTRSFKFPSRVDHDAVKASLKNGILSIAIPKAQPVQPRRINIE